MRWLPNQRQSAPGGPSSEADGQSPLSLARRVQSIRLMDRQHRQFQHMMQGNFLAPLADPQAILDIGCGNGRWVMEVAAHFSAARVVGIDIANPAPFVSLGRGLEAVPPNVSFMQGDALAGLSFPDAHFDLVHVRLLQPAIPAQAWLPLLRELTRITRPAGWVESLEMLPYAVQQGEGMARIVTWYGDLLRRHAIDPMLALKIPQLMKDAGLTAVTTREFKPVQQVNPSQDELRESREGSIAFIDEIRDAIIQADIAKEKAFDLYAAKARAELQSNLSLSTFNYYVALGQRPSPITP